MLIFIRLTCAGALDHRGISFSSVNKRNRSFAEAMNRPSTLTVDVFTEAALLGLEVVLVDEAEAEAVGGPGLGPVPTGVLVPDSFGVPDTVTEDACSSMMACGNSLNFASKASLNCDLATVKSASTAGEDVVEHFHWN